MIKRLWAKLWARLTGGTVVWLRDFDGEIILSVARRDPFGNLRADRWWPFSLYKVILHDDGSVTKPGGRSSYVKEWIAAK